MAGPVGMKNEMSTSLEETLQGFRESDRKREELLMEVVTHFHRLEHLYKEKCRDHDNEQMFRRHWQERHETVEQDYVSLRQSIENNCFVQVLIDGDAAYFQESLIKEGSEGGSKAAHMLLTEIRKHLESLYPGSELPIMVHIFANLGGLGGKLASLNVIDSPSDLYAFARGFNTSQDMFNIVDVGFGKEKADHKIREMFRVSLANKQCKHVIFSGCHDNGYMNILIPYQHDNDKRTKITLLETLPAERAFLALNFAMVRFPKIFNSEELHGTSQRAQVLSHRLSNTPAVPPIKPAVKPSPVASPGPNNAVPNTWAGTAVKNGLTEKTVSIAPIKSGSTAQKFILYNEDGYRIDAPMPPATFKDVNSLHDRINSGKKLCNEFFLRGKCGNGTGCHFSHDGKLNQGEILALRHKARTLSCSDMDSCEDYNCFYGHNCPYEARGGTCKKGNDCYFLDVHGINRRATLKIYEDGTEEELDS